MFPICLQSELFFDSLFILFLIHSSYKRNKIGKIFHFCINKLYVFAQSKIQRNDGKKIESDLFYS